MVIKDLNPYADGMDNFLEKLKEDYTVSTDTKDVVYENSIFDNVNHPAHYTDGNIEVIDFIEDKKLPYHLGNVVKYICRAGKKDPKTEVEDLEKAAWYLNRYLELKTWRKG